jgi:hypothetical protein
LTKREHEAERDGRRENELAHFFFLLRASILGMRAGAV